MVKAVPKIEYVIGLNLSAEAELFIIDRKYPSGDEEYAKNFFAK
jgi:hypothetical protein